MYFETHTKSTESTIYPAIELRSDSNPVIESCVFFMTNYNHPEWDGSSPAISVLTPTYQTHGSVRNNYINLGNNNLPVGQTWLKAIDWRIPTDAYVEFVNNTWNAGYDYRIFVDGRDMHTAASTLHSAGGKRVYIRDRQHGELKQNIPERNIWLEHSDGSIYANVKDWRVDQSKHIWVGNAPTGDVQISRRAAWKGVRFTVHFNVAVTLKHGSDYFNLAKGGDVTIPAGWVLDFVIDRAGIVREVGASTMNL